MRVGLSPAAQSMPAFTPSGKGNAASSAMVSGQNDRMAGSVPVFGDNSFAANFADQATTTSPKAAALVEDKAAPKSQESHFGFKDFLDIINPLQHIPVVSTIYQHVTGDTISPAAEVVGGGLFGGPIGAAASLASVAVKTALADQAPESGQAMSFQQVINTLSPSVHDTTIALADMRQGYMPYNG